MAYETKPNTGSLFKNDKRETDQQPNAKGQALIGGVAYWISSWTNTMKDGSKYQQLKFEPKDARQPAQQGTSRRATPSDDTSDVPF